MAPNSSARSKAATAIAVLLLLSTSACASATHPQLTNSVKQWPAEPTPPTPIALPSGTTVEPASPTCPVLHETTTPEQSCTLTLPQGQHVQVRLTPYLGTRWGFNTIYGTAAQASAGQSSADDTMTFTITATHPGECWINVNEQSMTRTSVGYALIIHVTVTS